MRCAMTENVKEKKRTTREELDMLWQYCRVMKAQIQQINSMLLPEQKIVKQKERFG